MAVMRRAERTVYILKQFMKGRQLTISDLLFELSCEGDDVSKRSLQRDIELLSEQQLIISFERSGRENVYQAWGYCKRN